MTPRVIPQEFYDRATLRVARSLIGLFLVHRVGGDRIEGMITEIEAYDGPHDKASHAHRGQTPRNTPMFGPPGHWYLYFTYGMHWMLNIVTGPKNYPAAVLIRGVGSWNGPGRVTRGFHITKSLAQTYNSAPATRSTGLWIEDRGIVIPSRDIRRAPRVGVPYAGPVWTKKPYRFIYSLKGDV